MANNFLGAIPRNISKNSTTKALILTTPEESIYDKIDKQTKSDVKSPRNWKTKQISEWNKKDLLIYFYARYRETYHAKLTNNIPWSADYASIEDIAVMIQKQLKIEVGVEVLKQYFDYCFNNDVINEILTKANKFTLNHLKKEKPVLQFASFYQKLSSPLQSVKEIPEENGLNIESLTSAYSIHSQYFVEMFGLIIPVNYLILVKKKSETDALSYVHKVIEKLKNAKNGEKKLALLVKLTQDFGPYPKWLPFNDINKLIPDHSVSNVAISDDNSKYEFLRSF